MSRMTINAVTMQFYLAVTSFQAMLALGPLQYTPEFVTPAVDDPSANLYNFKTKSTRSSTG